MWFALLSFAKGLPLITVFKQPRFWLCWFFCQRLFSIILTSDLIFSIPFCSFRLWFAALFLASWNGSLDHWFSAFLFLIFGIWGQCFSPGTNVAESSFKWFFKIVLSVTLFFWNLILYAVIKREKSQLLSYFRINLPLKPKALGDWPGGAGVKFTHSALVAQGSLVWIPSADLCTTYQAMLWQASHM